MKRSRLLAAGLALALLSLAHISQGSGGFQEDTHFVQSAGTGSWSDSDSRLLRIQIGGPPSNRHIVQVLNQRQG